MARKLASQKSKTTAILGTRVTKESGIYDKECHIQGIHTLYPSELDQQTVERIIQRALSWNNDSSDTEALLKVIRNVQKAGADPVVLACTDLQLCMPSKPREGVFDSMRSLAEASVKELVRQ